MKLTSKAVLGSSIVLSLVVGFLLAARLPRDTLSLAPFQATTTIEFAAGQEQASAVITNVPAHKQLVIEFVTYDGRDTRANFTHVHLVTTVAGITVRHALDVEPGGLVEMTQTSQLAAFGAEQTIRAYADPETPVELHVTRFDHSGEGVGNGTVTISGYFQER
jgi:hypothetical protein